MKPGNLPGPVRAVLVVLGLGYAGLVALLYSMQANFIFPGAMRQLGADASPSPTNGELQRLRTATGEEVPLWYGRAQLANGAPDSEAERRPTLLYFHGNGALLQDSEWEFQQFRRLGANVAIVEYPGYGEATGRAGEGGCYAAATAAYDYLAQRTDPRRLVVAGFSLGGGVAIDLAARRPVGGLITFSTFSSMVEMAGRQYPLVPAALLLQHRFDNLAKIRKVTCPILLAHGTADKLVPADMAGRLARAAGGPVTRLEVPGAGHNDFFTVGGAPVLEAVRDFLLRLPS